MEITTFEKFQMIRQFYVDFLSHALGYRPHHSLKFLFLFHCDSSGSYMHELIVYRVVQKSFDRRYY